MSLDNPHRFPDTGVTLLDTGVTLLKSFLHTNDPKSWEVSDERWRFCEPPILARLRAHELDQEAVTDFEQLMFEKVLHHEDFAAVLLGRLQFHYIELTHCTRSADIAPPSDLLI